MPNMLNVQLAILPTCCLANVVCLAQGDNHYLAAVATCKHTLLYDLEQGRGTNSLHATDRDMTDYFLVP